jgi:hypothetical protein
LWSYKLQSLRRASLFQSNVERNMLIANKGLERTNLELKYCESCGALWLRKQGVSEANCGACLSMWADLPGAWIERLKRKPVVEWRKVARGMHCSAAMAALEGGRR